MARVEQSRDWDAFEPGRGHGQELRDPDPTKVRNARPHPGSGARAGAGDEWVLVPVQHPEGHSRCRWGKKVPLVLLAELGQAVVAGRCFPFAPYQMNGVFRPICSTFRHSGCLGSSYCTLFCRSPSISQGRSDMWVIASNYILTYYK